MYNILCPENLIKRIESQATKIQTPQNTVPVGLVFQKAEAGGSVELLSERRRRRRRSLSNVVRYCLKNELSQA